MKKKILLFSILLLSGCSINYDLEISSSELDEQTVISTNLTANESYENESLTTVLDNLNNVSIYFDSNEIRADKYKITKSESNNIKNYHFSTAYSLNDFYRSAAINQCFKEFNIQTEDNYVLLRTNNRCAAFDNYPLLEAITINIKTDLNVIVSNADQVNDNIYTWHLTRDNYTNKAVRLTYSLPDDSEKTEDNTAKPSENPTSTVEEEKAINQQYKVIIIGSCFIILGLIILGVIKFKKH